MTSTASESKAISRCRTSRARTSARPPPTSSSVTQTRAGMRIASDMASGKDPALAPLVGLELPGAHRVRVARVEHVQQHPPLLVVELDHDGVRSEPHPHAP